MSKVKPSGLVLLACLAIGAVVAGAMGIWLTPNMRWFAYPLVTFGVACVLYPPLVHQLAAEKILDRRDTP